MSGVLVIGASHAGVAAAMALRKAGYDREVRLISREALLPYHRPPMSKAFGSRPAEAKALRPKSYYSDQNIDLVLGAEAAAIERDARQVRLVDGARLDYGTLILATGAEALRLPAAIDPDGASMYLRSFVDLQVLTARLQVAAFVAVIGGGLIGLEVAAALVESGRRVVVIERAGKPMERVAFPELSDRVAARHRQAGLELLTDTAVTMLRPEGNGCWITLSDGRELYVDAVVSAVGSRPNEALARDAGLACDDGVMVSAFGQTMDPAIYALGDCARWQDGGRTVRREAIFPATDQAAVIAAVVTGGQSPAIGTPNFWSDQGPVRLNMSGECEGIDEVVELPDPTGMGACLIGARRGRIVAVQCIDAPRQFRILREKIGQEMAGIRLPELQI